MPRVTVDHADFEAAFEVSADDLGPRAKIPPVFLYRLLAVGDDNSLRGMTAGF